MRIGGGVGKPMNTSESHVAIAKDVDSPIYVEIRTYETFFLICRMCIFYEKEFSFYIQRGTQH